jgi:hypothetical protein
MWKLFFDALFSPVPQTKPLVEATSELRAAF